MRNSLGSRGGTFEDSRPRGTCTSAAREVAADSGPPLMPRTPAPAGACDAGVASIECSPREARARRRWQRASTALVDSALRHPSESPWGAATTRGTACTNGAQQNKLNGCWNTAELLESIDRGCLTAGAPPVDLMVRSSGESRLSDFLVWQCRSAQLAWVPDLWPAFSLAAFARCVLRWQRQAGVLQAVRTALEDAPVQSCCLRE